MLYERQQRQEQIALTLASQPHNSGGLIHAVKREFQPTKKAPKCLFAVLQREAGLFGAQYRKTFFEAVNTTTYVQNFLLTSVERVAS